MPDAPGLRPGTLTGASGLLQILNLGFGKEAELRAQSLNPRGPISLRATGQSGRTDAPDPGGRPSLVRTLALLLPRTAPGAPPPQGFDSREPYHAQSRTQE